MRASMATTKIRSGSIEGPVQEDRIDPGVLRAEAHQEELKALRQSLQEQRRANTLLNAQVQMQTEAREAMEAQLIEANAEIADSWDHRKEMARVITDRDAKLTKANSEVAQVTSELEKARSEIAEARSEIELLRRRIDELRAESAVNRERQQRTAEMVVNRDGKISVLRTQIEELAGAVSNRNGKIAQLKADIHARYEELATLQRHIDRTSLSGRAKRLKRRLARLFRS